MNIFLRLIISLSCLTLAACAAESVSSKPTATTLMKTTTSWDGKPISYPEGQAEITGMMMEIPVGQETHWHLHPVPSFGMVTEGTLEVVLKDGKTKRVNEGETLVEVVNTVHHGRNIGNKPVKILIFYTGVVGSTLTLEKH